jgi:hypothetical protein
MYEVQYMASGKPGWHHSCSKLTLADARKDAAVVLARSTVAKVRILDSKKAVVYSS